MKKKLVKITTFLLIITFIFPSTSLANTYYYKGADPGRGFYTSTTDSTSTDSEREYVTAAVYETYDPKHATGRAYVRGYGRIESMEQYFGTSYGSMRLDTVKIGLRDFQGKLDISGRYPGEKTTSTWLSQISWLAGGAHWMINGAVTILANNLQAGIRHNISSYGNNSIEAFGYNLTKLNADNSYPYYDVERWASYINEGEEGLGGYFSYHIVNPPPSPYELRGYARATYYVNPYSYAGADIKYYSGWALVDHYVNNP